MAMQPKASKSNPLIEQMLLLYGQPNTPDVAKFLAVYATATGDVDPDTLADAAMLLARTRQYPTWPTIAECLDAIADSRKAAKVRGQHLEPIGNWDTWWGGLCGQVQLATSQAEIDACVAKVEPYARACWCDPKRTIELRAMGAKRMAELRVSKVPA